MKFKMGQKVKILSSKKTSGLFNYGTIIGIEKEEDAYYLGYISEKEYLARFTTIKYKVAYVDCYTNKASCLWEYEKNLQNKQ